MQGTVINERFLLNSKIGEGGMATVYDATDLESDQHVALKLMKTSLSGTAKRRFAREFRAIASVNHANCIRVLEFAETQDAPFFTMELFPGQPISQLSGNPLSVLYSALHQAASALEFAHRQQIIHRDVKPSNLLVQLTNGSTDRADRVVVKLTDFGLARFYGTPSSLSIDSGFVGTLAYSAPEQISNSVIDYRCDVYALGIVAYEVLAGKHPFDRSRQNNPQAMMRAHLADVPVSIRLHNAQVPPELDDAVLDMLEKNPARRPASPAILRSILGKLLGFEEDPGEEESSDGIAGGTWQSRSLVAREAQLSEVSEQMSNSLSPIQFGRDDSGEQLTPPIVFVIGEAGIGKSHFLTEVARLARRHGANVFEGRCFEGNVAPFQPFVEIVRQMLSQMSDLGTSAASELSPPQHTAGSPVDTPPSITGTHIFPQAAPQQASDGSKRKETVEDVVRNYSAELLRIAPDLHRALPGKAFRQVDLSREANYVQRAIASFFVEVANLHGTCLLIEDLHWVDKSTLDLLRHIVSAVYRSRQQSMDSNQSCPRLFICCTGRPNEVISSWETEGERFAKKLALPPLSTSETLDLIALSLNAQKTQVDQSLLDHVSHRCKGNPFFVTETLRLWQNSGRLVFSHGKWSLDESEDGSSSDWPDSVRGILKSRLKTVSESGQKILGPCSVIGAIIPVDLIQETVPELEEHEFLDTLDELLERQILFETADPTVLEFTHDLLRELTYEQLASHRRRALHRRVGEVLERSGRGRAAAEKLASHFYEARIVDRAFRYLLDASEAALGAYAIDEALKHLSRAEELEPEIEDGGLKSRMFGLNATAHNACGNPKEAIRNLQKQRKISPDELETGRILAEIGEVYFRVGEFDEAAAVFDESLQKIGDGRPKASTTVLLSIASSFSRMLLPQWMRRSRFKNGAKQKRMEVAHRVFSTLELLFAQRNVLHCAQSHGRHVQLAANMGDPDHLTHASSRQALIFGIFSFNWLALKAGRRALSYAQECDDTRAIAAARGHVGCAHYFGARLAEAEQLLRESVAILDRFGDSWERLYFYHNLRHLYSIIGDARQEIECARVEMQIGEAINDPEGTCWGAYGVANALARMGEHDEAQQYMERALGILSGRTNIVVVPTALQTYGFVHMQRGDYTAAQEMLEESCKRIRNDWAFIEYAVRAYPLLVECMLGPRWFDPSFDHPTAVIQRARRIRRAMMFCAWRFPSYLPNSLRIRGRVAWLLGKKQKAIHLLSNSIKAGEKIGARYDIARSLIDLSRLDESHRQEYRDQGQQILTELQAVLPVGEE